MMNVALIQIPATGKLLAMGRGYALIFSVENAERMENYP